MCCLWETHFDVKAFEDRKWGDGETFTMQMDAKRKSILISENLDFKPKTVTRDKEGHYITIKLSIQQQDLTIVNIYASNRKAPKYIKQ